MGFGAALTLRQRALAALARREHSRSELERKLAPHAESAEQLTALLDVLERDKMLSNQRFVESLVHRRMDRYGRLRISQELGQHDLPQDLVAERLAELKTSEIDRCREVWARKFDHLPADFAERMKQTRFLAARGFESHVIQKVLKGVSDE